MSSRPIVPALFFIALALPLAAGCKDDTKSTATPDTSAKAPEKIPDDFVVNDFLKDNGAKPRITADGGLEEGGLLAAGASTEPGSDTGDDSAADDDAVQQHKMKVLDPGAEPRAVRKYSVKQTVTRVATISMNMQSETNGQKQGGPQPPIAFTLQFTPKPGAKAKGASRIEAQIKKTEVVAQSDADKKAAAQAAPQLAQLNGFGLGFELSPQGAISDVGLLAGADKPPRIAQDILPVLTQVFELMAAPFPTDPIGVGAKWEEDTVGTEQGINTSVKSVYTLKSWTGDTGTVTAEVTRRADKQAIKDQRMPPGTTVAIKGTGSYTFDVKLDQISVHALGETTMLTKVEGQKPGAPAPETLLTQTIQTKQELK